MDTKILSTALKMLDSNMWLHFVYNFELNAKSYGSDVW